MSYAEYFKLQKQIEEEHGIELDRAQIISEHTGGAKTSLKALTKGEYRHLIDLMRENYSIPRTPVVKDVNQACDRMRKKIISLMRRMGYEKQDRADMPRIYGWIEAKGYLKKPLNNYTAKELPRLVSQVDRVFQSFLEAQMR